MHKAELTNLEPGPEENGRDADRQLDCSWAKHLKFHSASLTACLLYIRIGELTSGGKRNYYCKLEKMSEAILSDYRSVMAAARELVKIGVLEVVSQRRKHATEYRWIDHASYSATHPEECALCLDEGRRRELGPEFQGSRTKRKWSQSGAAGKPNPASVRNETIKTLTREWAKDTDGRVTFRDEERLRLSQLLLDYTEQELDEAFSRWWDRWDGEDCFAGNTFVQVADNLCYAARHLEKERKEQEVAHDATKKRLQAEAEAERRLIEQHEREQADLFDPIAQ